MPDLIFSRSCSHLYLFSSCFDFFSRNVLLLIFVLLVWMIWGACFIIVVAIFPLYVQRRELTQADELTLKNISDFKQVRILFFFSLERVCSLRPLIYYFARGLMIRPLSCVGGLWKCCKLLTCLQNVKYIETIKHPCQCMYVMDNQRCSSEATALFKKWTNVDPNWPLVFWQWQVIQLI